MNCTKYKKTVKVDYKLIPEKSKNLLLETGLAFLLDKNLSKVQWIGYGPFASYPGRHQANRYGFWAKHKDDLYFEGNHGGIDAALFSDKEGNGLLVVGDSLNINFEQTDRGIVMTVNAAVSGQGPKFARTAFNGWKPTDGPVGGSFRIYRIDASCVPSVFTPVEGNAPFKPFLTQYDTYLLKYNDIKQE